MTAPDTEQDAGLSEEDRAALVEALARCAQTQPTAHLLDLDGDVDWFGIDGGRHFMQLGGIDVLFDAAEARFAPLDPEPLRLLLAQRLREAHGEAAFDLGNGSTAGLDWEQITIEGETDQLIVASAPTVPAGGGEAVRASVRVDTQWQVTVEPLPAPAAEGGEGPQAAGPAGEDAAGGGAETAAEKEGAVVDGAYLGGYYGDSEFPFEGRDFVLDWSTWDTDQTTEEGLVGSSVEATTGGRAHRLYVWFDPAVGIQIVQAEPTGPEPAGAAADGAPDEPAHGITAAYLGEYYGADPVEFEGRAFVVDWTSWDPDQVTDEGLVGSAATGTGDDGREYRLYAWFDPSVGVLIAQAEPVDGDEGGGEEAPDPREHFERVLLEDLRRTWAGNGNRLVDGFGKEYDVRAWIEGSSEHEPELLEVDGEQFVVVMRMATTEDEPREVRCTLRIRSAEDVLVESEDSV